MHKHQGIVNEKFTKEWEIVHCSGGILIPHNNTKSRYSLYLAKSKAWLQSVTKNDLAPLQNLKNQLILQMITL